MVGGSPILMAPGSMPFPQSGLMMQQQPRMGVPAQLAAGQPIPPMPVQAPPRPNTQAPRPIKALGKIDDEPAPRRPASIRIPSPEELQITGQPVQDLPPASVDWVQIRRRLDDLGSVGFQMDRLPEGGYRFICLLPTAQADRHHRIEARAASEAEAIQLVLERAELRRREMARSN